MGRCGARGLNFDPERLEGRRRGASTRTTVGLSEEEENEEEED